MRQIPSDKYTIAWFKLADFVSRGEKERALALYRLLTHSIGDEALSYQLAGDLLRSFNDEQAVEKYQLAAELYKKHNRFLQAVAVYEQILSLQANKSDVLLNLIQLYTKLEQRHKLFPLYQNLTLIALQQNPIDEVIVLEYAQKAIDADNASIKEFLAKIKAVNEGIYEELSAFLAQ